MSHFSLIDYNWPYGFPPGATPPPTPPTDPPPKPDCDSGASGSIIECESQVLGEEIPVEGTPFKLEYSSRAMTERSIDFTISGATVPLVPQADRSADLGRGAEQDAELPPGAEPDLPLRVGREGRLRPRGHRQRPADGEPPLRLPHDLLLVAERVLRLLRAVPRGLAHHLVHLGRGARLHRAM